MSETEITKTLQDTTTSSIETSKTKINQSATKAGGEAGTNWMSEMKQKIKSDKSNLENTIKSTVVDASNNSQEITRNKGKELGNNYIDSTKKSMQSSKEGLENTIKQVTNDSTNSSIPNATQNGRNLGNKIIDGVKEGEINQKGSLSSTISQVVSNANSNVNTSSATTIGKNIISGIRLGITGNSWSLYNAMTSLGNSLLRTFKTAMGIHSPSREMASLAKFIPLGIAEGIDSTSDKAIGSMKSLITDIEDTASNMDIQYSIPKIPRNAIYYVPRQAISTNEIQRTIVGEDSNLLNKLLSNIQTNSKGKISITIPFIIDGEEWMRKTIELNEDYNLATNGGGL